jgi:hypothetical protein
MFTIIRIMLSNPTLRSNRRERAPIADANLEEPKGNPWKNELDRLAQRTPVPLASSNAAKRTPAAPPVQPSKTPAQATSDLSAWWGKSLTAQTVSPGNGGPGRKVPPKKVSRWQQL